MRPSAARSHLAIRHYAGAERHAHSGHHQLVMALNGAMDLSLDQTSATIDATTAVLVPDGMVHGFGQAGASRFLVMDMPVASLPSGLHQHLTAETAFFPVGPALGHLGAYLAAEGGDSLSPTVTHHAGALILEALSRQRAPAHQNDPRLERALRALDGDPAHPWTLPSLGRVAGASPTVLMGLWQEKFGESPFAYHTRLRLDWATRLITHGSQSLAEIALTVGYSDQTALTRAFRRWRGTTPGQLRRDRGQ